MDTDGHGLGPPRRAIGVARDWGMGLVSAWLDILYPRRCVGCGSDVPGPRGHICWECLRALDVITHPFCSICGDPVDGLVENEYVCSTCRDWPPDFDVARSAVMHRGALRHAIHAFKYRGQTSLDRDLAGFLQACVSTHYTNLSLNAVTYVPLYPAKKKERTYNQSHLLAVGLSKTLGLPPASGALVRTRHTPAQAGLNAGERRRNVKGAFAVRNQEWVRGRRILLVDDVMTTGSTVGECAATLKKGGADFVAVVTVARG